MQTITKHIGEGFARGELYAALAYDSTDQFGGMRIKAISSIGTIKVATTSTGIAFYSNQTVTAGGTYGVYSSISLTSDADTAGAFGVYGDVTWVAAGSSGKTSITGVKGRVTINDDFDAGAGYVYGTVGELAFGSSADIDDAESVFASLCGVITGNSGTYANGNICALFLDNQLKTDVTALNGYYSFIHMANNNTGAADRTVENAILLFGTSVTNFVQFRGCTTGGMVASRTSSEDHFSGTVKSLRINIDGVEYFLLASTALAGS